MVVVIVGFAVSFDEPDCMQVSTIFEMTHTPKRADGLSMEGLAVYGSGSDDDVEPTEAKKPRLSEEIEPPKAEVCSFDVILRISSDECADYRT